MNGMNTQQTSKERVGNLFSIRSLTVIGMLAAVATVLMLFEIPLWFAPIFYEIDLSEVPVLIGAFALGPMAGVVIELVKILINFIVNGTDTAGIGEFANFLLGCAFVLPSAYIYHRRKTIKTAFIGLMTGTIMLVVVGSILNAYILLPTYAKIYGMPIDALVQMGTAVNPSINSLSTFVLFAVVPFNLLKGIIVSIATLLLYKRLSIVIKTITK